MKLIYRGQESKASQQGQIYFQDVSEGRLSDSGSKEPAGGCRALVSIY